MAITLQTAEEEYRKNPDIKKQDIARLMEWVDRQPHLPNLTAYAEAEVEAQSLASAEVEVNGGGGGEVDIIVFYHSCDLDTNLTKTTIDLNLTLRTQLKAFFKDRDPMDKKNAIAFDVFIITPLPELTPEGYKVVYCALLDDDPSHFNLELAVKAFMMVGDLLQYEEGTHEGVIIVLDLQKMVFGHLTRLGIMTIKDVLFYLQEATPVRLKGFHFMNAPSFMDRILGLMRPFMKRRFMDTLHVHSAPGAVHRFVPRRALPQQAGGDYLDFEKIRVNTLHRLKANRKLLMDEEKLRVMEALRPGKGRGKTSKVDGSFKKLDID